MPLNIIDLEDVRIASPCSMRWEEMTGGDRVRFCAACQKNVFNLSGMKRTDALDLLRATDGKVCARFYKRADGTVLTADCPVGLALVARRAKRMALGAIASSLGAVAAVLGFLATTPMRRVVDTAPLQRVVVEQTHKIEEQHSALVVPNEPTLPMPYAGGISIRPAPTPTPPQPKPKTTHHAEPKKVMPPPEPFMGDIDVGALQNIEHVER